MASSWGDGEVRWHRPGRMPWHGPKGTDSEQSTGRRRPASTQFEFHPGQDHLDSDPVVAALGKDDVGVPLGGLDELEVHRADGSEILPDHVVQGAPPFRYVP